MEEVAANFKFLLEFYKSCFLDIRIAVVFLILLCVVPHGFFQRLGNTDIVYNQTTGLTREHAVYAGDGLHQVVTGHGFVHVHRCQ